MCLQFSASFGPGTTIQKCSHAHHVDNFPTLSKAREKTCWLNFSAHIFFIDVSHGGFPLWPQEVLEHEYKIWKVRSLKFVTIEAVFGGKAAAVNIYWKEILFFLSKQML